MRVALTGLEIWSDRDKIRVEKSPSDTLNNFLEWRTRELLPRLRHDNAQLVMYEHATRQRVSLPPSSAVIIAVPLPSTGAAPLTAPRSGWRRSRPCVPETDRAESMW